MVKTFAVYCLLSKVCLARKYGLSWAIIRDRPANCNFAKPQNRLGYLLALEKESLAAYSEELRRETEHDHQYWDQAISESIQRRLERGEGD